MITTKNRLLELKKTLAVLDCLDPKPFEILVTADGCDDGSVEYVREHHPQVELIVNEEGQGSVASRHHMMQIAKGDYVLALDDDSHPEQQDCLAYLVRYFEEHSNVAIATFPQRTDEYPESLKQKDFGEDREVRSFPNSGAFFRVSTYRALPGFEPLFFHMYEEPDYALQCVAHGWKVMYLPEITVRHYWTSNQRSELRNHHRHARNECWAALLRCPMPYVFLVIFYRCFAQFRYALSRGASWWLREPLWWLSTLSQLSMLLQKRDAVTWAGYKHWLALKDI